MEMIYDQKLVVDKHTKNDKLWWFNDTSKANGENYGHQLTALGLKVGLGEGIDQISLLYIHCF